jgi:quinol monooxygenase YgiN
LVVLAVIKWDIHPDKIEAYQKWTGSAIKRALAVPGVIKYRAYRGLAGTTQVMSTFEFADLAAYAAWRSNEEVQKVTDEMYTVTLSATTELWGPSPIVPKPIRPGK